MQLNPMNRIKINLVFGNTMAYLGIWIYFYILNLYVVSLGGGVSDLAILTLSYTLPGLFVPFIARTLLNYVREDYMMIISMFVRTVCIIGIAITNHINLILFFVFLEQGFSLIYTMCYDLNVTNVSNESNSISVLNSVTSFFSGGFKILSVPIATFLILQIQIKNVFWFVAIMYIISLLLFILMFIYSEKKGLSVKPRELLQSRQENKNIVAKSPMRLMLNQVPTKIATVFILMFVVACTLRLAFDSFSIAILPKQNIDIVYASVIMCYDAGMICAALLSDYLLRKLQIKKKANIFIVASALSSISILMFINFKNIIILCLTAFILSLSINVFELVLKQTLQTTLDKNNLVKALSFQVIVYNIMAVSISSVGGFMGDLNIIRYFIFLSITVLLVNCLFYISTRWRLSSE